MDTTRKMALTIIRDDYFSTCIKGKKRKYIEKILGTDYRMIRQENEEGYAYKFQMIFENYCQGLCGYASISLDKRGRAIFMNVVSY